MGRDEVLARFERCRRAYARVYYSYCAYRDMPGTAIAENDPLGQMDLRRSYLADFVTNSRAFTGALKKQLQRVAGGPDDYEAWWAPHRRTLQESEVARLFHRLRNPLEHEGVLELGETLAVTNWADVVAPGPGDLPSMIHLLAEMRPVIVSAPGSLAAEPAENLMAQHGQLLESILVSAGEAFHPDWPATET